MICLTRLVLQGLGAGAVVLWCSKGHSSRILVFNEDLFFLYLLPPIIFNAGYGITTSMHTISYY